MLHGVTIGCWVPQVHEVSNLLMYLRHAGLGEYPKSGLYSDAINISDSVPDTQAVVLLHTETQCRAAGKVQTYDSAAAMKTASTAWLESGFCKLKTPAITVRALLYSKGAHSAPPQKHLKVPMVAWFLLQSVYKTHIASGRHCR